MPADSKGVAHWYFNTNSPMAITFNFESLVEVLSELRSAYEPVVVHSMPDLDVKTGVNPLKN